MTVAIPPKMSEQITKYAVYGKDGFQIGVRDDAPQEVKDFYSKFENEYNERLKKGQIM